MSAKKTKNTVRVLNSNINSTSERELLAKLKKSILQKHKFFVVTPNPEIIMKAQRDVILSKILNSASFAVPDGIGVVAASKFLSLPNPKDMLLRIPVLILQGLGVGVSILFDRNWLQSDLKVIKGRELFERLIKMADKERWRVFLLGGTDGVAERAAAELVKKYEKLEVRGMGGPILDEGAVSVNQREKKVEGDVVDAINKFKPELLFVGFGAPKQEKWVHKMLSKLSVGGAMVVGGTFNYISGDRQPLPSWVEKSNMEWLWRMLSGSQERERIYSAIIDFPLAVFYSKLKSETF